VRPEDRLHLDLCEWLDKAYPNVEFRTDGGGLMLSPGAAKKYARMQKRRAFPDLFLPEPRWPYHGMYLEIKTSHDKVFRKDGSYRQVKHIREQLEVLELLNVRGYYAVFGCGWDNCIVLIQNYLRRPLWKLRKPE